MVHNPEHHAKLIRLQPVQWPTIVGCGGGALQNHSSSPANGGRNALLLLAVSISADSSPMGWSHISINHLFSLMRTQKSIEIRIRNHKHTRFTDVYFRRNRIAANRKKRLRRGGNKQVRFNILLFTTPAAAATTIYHLRKFESPPAAAEKKHSKAIPCVTSPIHLGFLSLSLTVLPEMC